MKDFELKVTCSICSNTEMLVANSYERSIFETMNAAYQTNKKGIDPYFKIAKTVLAGKKGEVNWEQLPMCEDCRNLWDALETKMVQQLSDFRSG